MRVKQLSVFLENRRGRLAHVTNVLADAGVNLLALSLADTSDFGILRLIVDDVEGAQRALQQHNIVAMVNEVMAVAVADEPGGLARVLNVLMDAGVNVEYMYAFSQRQTGRAALIFRFDDPDKASKTLQEAGIDIFAHVDLL